MWGRDDDDHDPREDTFWRWMIWFMSVDDDDDWMG